MKNIALASSLLVALAMPSLGSAKSLEDLLVEKGVITKSEATASASDVGAKVYYNNGTRFEFPDAGFTSQINTQIQTRYVYTDNEEGTDTSSFEFRRARLILSGTAMHSEFTYLLQTDFVGTSASDGSRSPDLRDAYIQWNANKEVGVRMGQYKTFVSRQENSSSSKLQFADRSTASNFFELGRQQGLSARYTGMDGNFFSGVAIFNGESEGEGRNKPGIDTRHTGVVTARYTVMGKIDPFEEGDVNHTEDVAWNVGAAYAMGQTSGEAGKFDKHTVSADTSFKYQGLSLHAEYFYRQLDPDAAGNDANVEPMAFYVQGGYFLVPKKFEIAARYAFTDCDDGKFSSGLCRDNEDLSQVTAGLNYYFWKHNLKAQLNWDWIEGSALEDGADDTTTNRIIFQLSSYF